MKLFRWNSIVKNKHRTRDTNYLVKFSSHPNVIFISHQLNNRQSFKRAKASSSSFDSFIWFRLCAIIDPSKWNWMNGWMKHFDDDLFWRIFFFFSYSSLFSILCSVLDILVFAFDLYETKWRIAALAILYTYVLCRMFNWTEEIDYSNGRRPLTFSSILSFNQFIWQAFTVLLCVKRHDQ